MSSKQVFGRIVFKPLRGADRKPVHQRIQILRRDGDLVFLAHRPFQRRPGAIVSAVVHFKSVSRPAQCLEVFPRSSAEQEQAPGERILSQLFLNDPREAVDPFRISELPDRECEDADATLDPPADFVYEENTDDDDWKYQPPSAPIRDADFAKGRSPRSISGLVLSYSKSFRKKLYPIDKGRGVW